MNEFDRNPRIVSAAPSADEPSQPDKPVPFHHVASSAGCAVIF